MLYRIKHFSGLMMAAFYLIAGINHFLAPGFYEALIPPDLTWSLGIIYISGVFEILLGLFLLPNRFRRLAAYAAIVLLILVFPANIYLAWTNGDVSGISPLIAWGRLPLQLIFIAWAWWHTQPESNPTSKSTLAPPPTPLSPGSN